MAAALTSSRIIGWFFQGLETATIDSVLNLISWLNSGSDQETEEYKGLGMSPAMREMIGGIQPRGLRTVGYSLKNKRFEASIEVLVDELRRDKTGQVQNRIQQLAQRAVEHWSSLLSTLISAGEAGTCYDGSYFFAADHSEGSSGTQVNLLTSSQVGRLAVATPAAPTVAEMVQAIMGVVAYMTAYKDDQGEPINAGARQWLVLCPPGNIWAATAQAVSSAVVGSSTNPLVGNRRFTVDADCDPRLTWTTNFCVFRADGIGKAFIRQEEVPGQLHPIAEGSEEETRNARHIYSYQAVRNAGYGEWQRAAKCTLS
jgi:phage major head subunit gpT-like protein